VQSNEIILPDFPIEKFELSAKILSQYVNNKDIFKTHENAYRKAIGVTIECNFSTKNQRRSYFQDCNVINTNFESAGYLGSIFKDSDFTDCNFRYANFHSCNFENTLICSTSKSYLIKSAGFHKSTFSETIFRDISFFSCGFTDVMFSNCVFENCTFRLCSMENAIFRNCIFINVTMRTQNLEYVQFENPYMNQVILPFAPLTFLFKGLGYILHSSDKIMIYSAGTEGDQISPVDYAKLLPDFINFHLYEKNYFPLANIYIATKDYGLAYKSIIAGVLEALKIRDFRMLAHFCKIIYLNDVFSFEERQQLLENITTWAEIQSFRDSELHSYKLNIGNIRQMLIYDNFNKPTLTVLIKTNITTSKKIHILIECIEKLLPINEDNRHYIELRHNSPLDAEIILICHQYYDVFKTIALLYATLHGINKFVDIISSSVTKIQDIILKNDKHKKYRQEYLLVNQEKQLNLEKQMLDIEKLKNEINNFKKDYGEVREIIKSNNIEIYSLEHFLYNTPYIINNQFLGFKSKL
jgi:uncharacterized protein YjbI with pentapeptide repeats